MRQNRFPPGWDEERVSRVLAHYEQQTEEEAVAEDEAVFEDSTQASVEVPKELLPAIRELIAKQKKSVEPNPPLLPPPPRPPAWLQARTVFPFGAFALSQPHVMRVLSIEDPIRLEVDLTLRPAF